MVSGRDLSVRFEAMTRADGIPTDRAYQVLEDRRGFIWFTTMAGLVRHDGYQSILYPGMPLVASTETANPLPGMLFEDRHGTLWVATDVLSRFDPNLGKFTTVLNPRPLLHGPELIASPLFITAQRTASGWGCRATNNRPKRPSRFSMRWILRVGCPFHTQWTQASPRQDR